MHALKRPRRSDVDRVKVVHRAAHSMQALNQIRFTALALESKTAPCVTCIAMFVFLQK